GNGVDEDDFPAFEIPRRRLDRLQIVLGFPDVQDEVFSLFQPELPESLPQSVDHHLVFAAEVDDPNARDIPGRLTLGGKRPGEGDPSRQGDERPSVHYSITSSARASTEGGMVRPRALAVFRLMTSSNLVGCSTGRSAGWAPLRILST